MDKRLIIIGGGLAGSEAAWQAAQRGIQVELFEMRPQVNTGAHETGELAELICSNSLGSNLPDRAAGLLKQELRCLGSLLIKCADETALPAGGALAVDRNLFAKLVTQLVESHDNIEIIREEVKQIPLGPVIIASGPLTSESLSKALINLSGQENLFFFDAIAPIVTIESINQDIAFRGSRYSRGTQEEGDYINCPLNADEYKEFVEALVLAERIDLSEFDREVESGVNAGTHKFFEGCLPIEILARRHPQALAYGPLRPVGLTNPRTGRRPHAVVQLRQDNLAGTLYNLVGFQTNLKFSEQKRIFHMIPGLEKADFQRYGQMHRNTFVHAPNILDPTLGFKKRPDIIFAGQITGVEGYAGNIGTGLLAGVNAARMLKGENLHTIPRATMLGALCYYITNASPEDFQPMKANYGIMPPLTEKRKMNKRERAAAYSERALKILAQYIEESNFLA